MAVELATAYVNIVPSTRGMASKMRREVGGPLESIVAEAGRSGGRGFASNLVSSSISGLDRLGSIINRTIVGGVAAGVAAGGVLIGAGLFGGIQRALDREEAVITFGRLGLDDRAIQTLTDGIDQALRGTPITNPQGFQQAGRFLAMGFTEEDIPGIIGTIADAASVANRDFGEMADVFARAAGQGRITAAELNRMGDIPLGRVAEALGMTEDAMRDLAGTGGLTAEMFLEGFASIEAFAGAARDPTTRVAADNLRTAWSALGESFVGPLFGEDGPAIRFLEGLREALNIVAPDIRALGAAFAAWLVPNLEAVTADIVPFVQGLMGISQHMDPITGELWDMENAANDLGLAIRDVVTQVSGAVSSVGVWASANPQLTGALAVAVPLALGLASAINAIKWAFLFVAKATPVGLIIGLVGALTYAWQNSETFRDTVIGAWESVLSFVGPAIDRLSEWLTGIRDWLTGITSDTDAMRDGVSGAWQAVQTAVAPIIKWFGHHVLPVLRSVADFAVEWFGLIGTAFGTLMSQIETVWGAIGDPTMRIIEGAFTQLGIVAGIVWDAILTVIETTLALVTDVIDAATALLRGDWEAFWDAIGGIVDTVWSGIKSTVETVFGGVLATILNILITVKRFWGSVWDGISTKVGEIWEDIKSTVEDGVSDVITFVLGLPAQVKAAVSDAGEWLLDAGKAIIQGLIDGITDMFGKLTDTVGNAAGMVRDFFPFSPAKEGPLSGSGWTRYAGENLIDDLADGVRRSTSSLRSTVSSSVDGLLAGSSLNQVASGGYRAAAVGPSTIQVLLRDDVVAEATRRGATWYDARNMP